MATSSLGTLTLDLAVKLSEFSDGLTRAEREARDSTSNISDSVSGMRDSIADDMSKISGSFAGMAIGGAIVAAGALASMAVEAAKADVQMSIMAGTANTSLKNFQVLTHAAQGLGVEQDALASILADVQEKLGEFSATGGGGAADFFEALQNNTKMTDEEITNLGKTLQGKDGVEAIQVVKDKMDELGATSQEQRFVFESLAGDLGNLMGLFSDGGQILDDYGVKLTDAGVIKTEAAIDQSKILAAETMAIQTKFEGLKTQLVTDMIPALGTLATYFADGTEKGADFKDEVSEVGKAVNGTAALIVGLAAGVGIFSSVMQQFSIQAGSLGQTVEDFYNADGLKEKGAALAAGMTRQAAAGVAGYMTITNQYKSAVDTINTLMDGQKLRLSDLGQTYYTTNNFLQSYNEGLEVSTKQADANAKAEEERAKAIDKTAKAQSRLVGISGDTGIGSAHLHVQYRDKSRAVSAADLARFQVGGKNITDYRKTSGYGPRNTGIKGASTYHRGTDYAVPKNTDITTSVPVKNVKTWLDKKGGGYVSTITFGDGVVIDLLHQMPGIMGIEKGETTGNNQIDGAIKKADAMWQKSADDAARAQEKAAADAIRAQEETLRKQASVAGKWAHEKEKIEIDYQNNKAEVEQAHAKGSADYIKYMARVEERYIKDKNAGVLSLSEKYFSEEQRIHADHKKAMEVIEKTYIEDDNLRQYYVDAQNAAYEKDLENFRWAAGAKAREQDKMYQSIANSAKANGANAFDNGLDSMAQRTMSDDDYAVWRVGQDYRESSKSVNDQYTNRKSEINDTDERGDFKLPALERFELLELAKQEHLDNMWAMEQNHALKEKSLSEQLQNAKLENYSTTLGAMGGLLGAFAGENNRVSQMMFAAQKGYALAQIFMNNKVALSEAWASAPFPYNVPAVTMAALETGALAAAAQAITPMFSGIAHGGLDYVPKEQTYLLDKGERVLSPNQNKDFTNFMQGNKGGNSYSGDGVGEVNIVVTVDAKGNGSMTGDTADAFARTMAQQVEQTARNVVRKELMQGGMIDNRLRR
ncbi:hypothetical protein Q8P09_03360 [Psychrobacter faecalis]|uniref:Phage tail tape measure protein n=1 Tax=Psychrobacter faecalis TaxID=180588 RepID=A0ABT9HEB6_9GAMM|nr:hypothetical protein [Psychrobacter faecalis]MDP4544116.1 hypothetical protein [Psychrobacter faecalis]